MGIYSKRVCPCEVWKERLGFGSDGAGPGGSEMKTLIILLALLLLVGCAVVPAGPPYGYGSYYDPYGYEYYGYYGYYGPWGPGYYYYAPGFHGHGGGEGHGGGGGGHGHGR